MGQKYDFIVRELQDHIKSANLQIRQKMLLIQKELRLEDDSDGHTADGRTDHTDL